MKLHRFFVKDMLAEEFWMDDQNLFNQWVKVLRFRVGTELLLFDGEREERLYRITQIGNNAVRLKMITAVSRKLPNKDVYLFFSLLKKDKNEWVLQKCTEIGVKHFVPVISGRIEKTGFVESRAERIVIEAAEQCGRSDIPSVRQPITLETAIREFSGKLRLFYAEQGKTEQDTRVNHRLPYGVFVGPEGGWTDEEKNELGKVSEKLDLGDFVLRAETACIAASFKLLN